MSINETPRTIQPTNYMDVQFLREIEGQHMSLKPALIRLSRRGPTRNPSTPIHLTFTSLDRCKTAENTD